MVVTLSCFIFGCDFKMLVNIKICLFGHSFGLKKNWKRERMNINGREYEVRNHVRNGNQKTGMKNKNKKLKSSSQDAIQNYLI